MRPRELWQLSVDRSTSASGIPERLLTDFLFFRPKSVLQTPYSLDHHGSSQGHSLTPSVCTCNAENWESSLLPSTQNRSYLGFRHLARSGMHLLDYNLVYRFFVNLINAPPISSVSFVHSIKVAQPNYPFQSTSNVKDLNPNSDITAVKSRFSKTSDEWKYLVRLFYKYTKVLLLKYVLKVLRCQ